MSEPTTPRKNTKPSKIGGYTPTQQIGHGAMGDIWLCHDPSMDRMVVVKQMHASLMNQDDLMQRFQREAVILAHLNHPVIVQPHALWKEKDGKLSLSMEFVQGKSLRELLNKDSRPPVWAVMYIMYEILSAVGHAHREGVIHRDLKPANIMIDKDGRVRLLDFGVAHAETEDTALTMAGAVIGTAAYMSPEQILGFEITPASDLFSIGIVMSEMLIGENLFRGENLEQTSKRIQKLKLSMKAFPDDVPKPLRKFVMKFLEKKPKNRPVSACDAADQLAKMLLPYPRDLTPYLADWVYSTSQDTVSELTVPVTPNRSKRIFATGAVSGFILALVLVTLAYLIL